MLDVSSEALRRYEGGVIFVRMKEEVQSVGSGVSMGNMVALYESGQLLEMLRTRWRSNGSCGSVRWLVRVVLK